MFFYNLLYIYIYVYHIYIYIYIIYIYICIIYTYIYIIYIYHIYISYIYHIMYNFIYIYMYVTVCMYICCSQPWDCLLNAGSALWDASGVTRFEKSPSERGVRSPMNSWEPQRQFYSGHTPYDRHMMWYEYWLVVSTPLKNISQWENKKCSKPPTRIDMIPMTSRWYLLSFTMKINMNSPMKILYHWPFQEPKLEILTVCEAYVRLT